MNKLSKGTKLALLGVGIITLIGAIITITDYWRHGDLLNIWWPIIGLIVMAIIYFGGRKTDIVPAVAIWLLCFGSSCSRPVQPTGDSLSEVHTVEQTDSLWQTRHYQAEGYTHTVARKEWK